MKVRLITGGAPRHDDPDAESWLSRLRPLVTDYLIDHEPDLVIVGCAAGVDAFARDWCDQDGAGADLLVGKALWRAFSRGAGTRRNGVMAQAAAAFAMSTVNDVRCAAFPGPQSKGTWNMVRICEEYRIPVETLGPWWKR